MEQSTFEQGGLTNVDQESTKVFQLTAVRLDVAMDLLHFLQHSGFISGELNGKCLAAWRGRGLSEQGIGEVSRHVNTVLCNMHVQQSIYV